MKVIQILHLEDDMSDAEFVRAALKRGGLSVEIHLAGTRDDFQAQIERRTVDLIISDFAMPGYDGLSALRLARIRHPEVPFIFVSGRLGEEAAVEALRNGATDYITKDRLPLLPSAVERALRETHERKKRQEAESALREQEKRFAEEQRQLEQKFLRAQRMESLGILAGGIAHDLNNVLLPVLLGCEVLRDAVRTDADREVLAMLEQSATRGSGLIRQVLTFARGTGEEKILMNPAHLLKDIGDMARRTFPAEIAVRSDIARDLMPIQADPTQIHQVFMNLIVNARDAMPAGGTLKINARNVPAADVTDRFRSPPPAGVFVQVEFSDSGAGIPVEIQERIFEPFFSTKETGKGTGLGLSTTLGIVNAHGGYIDFQTEVGRGTTFRVSFPAASASEPAPPPDLIRPDLGGAAEVVLIIDDELAAREMTKVVLGRHAYQVLTAANGAEGLNLFSRFRDRIDAVLVDHRMPLMDGPQTVQEMKKLASKAKFIGMSGHAADKQTEQFNAAGVDAFLPKPFTAEQVLTILHALLHPGRQLPPVP